MKYLFLLLSLAFALCSSAQKIEEGEYFFNSDPGYGKAEVFNFVAGSEIDFTENISTENLSEGSHTLYYRFKNSDNVWGATSTKVFYKGAKLAQKVVKGEYFFNVDPGFGNGKTFSVPQGQEMSFTEGISTLGMNDGSHTLYYRFKDDNGKWGQTSSHNVYKVVTPRITNFYYKINNQQAQEVKLFAKLELLDLTLNNSIADLDDGEHTISFWVVNEFGTQSEIWTEYFSKGSTSVGGANSSTEINLYPNPTSDFINIACDDKISSVKVYNLHGNILINESSEIQQINLEGLKSGTYIVSIITNSGILVKPIVKK